MSTIQIIGGAVLLILCVVVIFATTVKEPKSNGLGAIGGDNNSYFDKNSGRTKDAMLARIITYSGIGMVVVALALLFIIK
ncbi:MAG: preprotein translocase subunit SecG [Oscillospiraceae bacterium]